jgi:hypothetical protein
MAKLSKGDHVQWSTSQGTTSGKIERIVEGTTTVGGTKLKGSKDEPIYIVKSDKTGKRAGHKAGALKKKSS